MALLKWTDMLSVGIHAIDEQHKVLIDMINNFYNKINEKSNNELISELIGKMKDYTMVHFHEEEALFKKYNYTEFENHKKEHDHFIEKVKDLENRFKEGKIILSYEITAFLKDWLIKHIQGTDMKYSQFLIQKGVK